MKKLKRILACVMLSLLMIPAFMNVGVRANAAQNQSNIFTKSTFGAEVNAILTENEFLKFKERMPGSEGELKAAQYIINYLDLIPAISKKNDNHVKEGVQGFQFESTFDGLLKTSQNIVYSTNNKKFDKKVIIGCHYDAFAMEQNPETLEIEYVASESINGSAGNVAFLLALAKNLEYMTLDYNVEIVFFGAGESNNAGSKIYSQGISSKEAENILCMINIDEIAYGKNLYFYSHEVKTKATEFVADVIKENKVDVDEIDVVNLNKLTMVQDELNLGYTHIALQSDNINFMKLGITTFNFFAGDYSTGLVAGKSEFLDEDNITYTENDNLTYIAETQKADFVVNNLYETYKAVTSVLTDFDFVKVMTASVGETSWFYDMFANSNLVLYLTVVAFFVILIIAMFVYYRLSIKAYHANVETEFLSSVVKICEQIDENGTDPNIPKAVSQVIARDIKKDKTIKSRRKKKDSE